MASAGVLDAVDGRPPAIRYYVSLCVSSLLSAVISCRHWSA